MPSKIRKIGRKFGPFVLVGGVALGVVAHNTSQETQNSVAGKILDALDANGMRVDDSRALDGFRLGSGRYTSKEPLLITYRSASSEEVKQECYTLGDQVACEPLGSNLKSAVTHAVTELEKSGANIRFQEVGADQKPNILIMAGDFKELYGDDPTYTIEGQERASIRYPDQRAIILDKKLNVDGPASPVIQNTANHHALHEFMHGMKAKHPQDIFINSLRRLNPQRDDMIHTIMSLGPKDLAEAPAAPEAPNRYSEQLGDLDREFLIRTYGKAGGSPGRTPSR